MERRVSMNNVTSSEDWQPLLNYRNSLLHGETDQAAPAPITKKVYGRKGKKNQGIDDDGDDV